VEVRYPDDVEIDIALAPVRGHAPRVELLADRVLLYTNDGDAAVKALHADGVRPTSVLVRRSTLEDVFLILTGRTLED
jgi:lipooligosaccharide transport system ATP-binding protein